MNALPIKGSTSPTIHCLNWEEWRGGRVWVSKTEHWQQIHRNTQGRVLRGKITMCVCVQLCMLVETVYKCVCPSGVCNLCCLCLLPGCDAEGGCDGNLPQFKSTAGTSKPTAAAAGITKIIRHKRLIYIKMLINLFSLSHAELGLCTVYLSVWSVCVWRHKCTFLVGHEWGVIGFDWGFRPSSLPLCFCRLTLRQPSQSLFHTRPCVWTLLDSLLVWSDEWASLYLSRSKMFEWIPSFRLKCSILRKTSPSERFTPTLALFISN